MIGRYSSTSFWISAENQRLKTNLDHIERKLAAVAFVVETRRADGDYVPERRFRALLPGGTLAYGATREEAEAAFWGAVEKEGGGLG